MSDQSIRASQISAAKTSAEQDLKVALSYVEDAEQPFFDKKRTISFDNTPGLFAKLDKAAQYLAAARAKNPDQSLTIEDEKDGPVTYTQDDIAGAISFREGRVAFVAWQTAFNEDNKNEASRRAQAAFQKATRFCPNRASYYLNLADVCRLQGDKKAASANVAAALRLEPESTDAIKLNDEINQLPDVVVTLPPRPRKRQHYPFLYAFLAGIACFALGFPLAWNVRPTDIGASTFPVLLFLAGFALVIGSIFFKIKFAFEPSEPDPYELYKSARLEKDVTAIVHEQYEQRYQSEIERR